MMSVFFSPFFGGETFSFAGFNEDEIIFDDFSSNFERGFVIGAS